MLHYDDSDLVLEYKSELKNVAINILAQKIACELALCKGSMPMRVKN